MLQLELGGGGQPISKRDPSKANYKNMDAYAMPTVDIVHDATVAPWPFEDNSVSDIYSCEFMEHISPSNIMTVLSEAYRVLAPGGSFAFECPDFEGIALRLLKLEPTREEIKYMKRGIFGDHSRQYDYHLNTMFFRYIADLMNFVGFMRVQRFDPPLEREDYQELLKQFTPEFIKGVKLCVSGIKP